MTSNPIFCLICDRSPGYYEMTVNAIRALRRHTKKSVIGVIFLPKSGNLYDNKKVLEESLRKADPKISLGNIFYKEGSKHFESWNPTQHKLDIELFAKEGYDPIVWIDSDTVVLKNVLPHIDDFVNAGKKFGFLADHVNGDPNFRQLWQGPLFIPQASYMMFRSEFIPSFFKIWENTWREWITPYPFAINADPAPFFPNSFFCIEQYALGQAIFKYVQNFDDEVLVINRSQLFIGRSVATKNFQERNTSGSVSERFFTLPPSAAVPATSPPPPIPTAAFYSDTTSSSSSSSSTGFALTATYTTSVGVFPGGDAVLTFGDEGEGICTGSNYNSDADGLNYLRVSSYHFKGPSSYPSSYITSYPSSYVTSYPSSYLKVSSYSGVSSYVSSYVTSYTVVSSYRSISSYRTSYASSYVSSLASSYVSSYMSSVTTSAGRAYYDGSELTNFGSFSIKLAGGPSDGEEASVFVYGDPNTNVFFVASSSSSSSSSPDSVSSFSESGSDDSSSSSSFSTLPPPLSSSSDTDSATASVTDTATATREFTGTTDITPPPQPPPHIDEYYMVDLIQDNSIAHYYNANQGPNSFFVIDRGEAISETISEIQKRAGGGNVVVFKKRN